MTNIKFNINMAFTFLVAIKPNIGYPFSLLPFLEQYPFINKTNHKRTMNSLAKHGVVKAIDGTDLFYLTQFGFDLVNLHFSKIREEGSKDNVQYLNYLVKNGAFSHMERH